MIATTLRTEPGTQKEYEGNETNYVEKDGRIVGSYPEQDAIPYTDKNKGCI